MRTLSITISDLEYNKFGLKTDQLTFSDLVDLISRELSRRNLSMTAELLERFGLLNMPAEEISAAINAVRDKEAHS